MRKNTGIVRGRRWLAAGIMMAAVLLGGISVMAAPAIKEVSYEGKGKVEVDFLEKVQYKKVSVTVTDSKGKDVKAVVTEKDRDDLDFRIKEWKDGEAYAITIRGIRKWGESTYGTLSTNLTIPKITDGIWVKEVEYDAKDREVEIDFGVSVQWTNPTITITKGKTDYTKALKKTKKREAEVKVKRLKKGVKYHYTIQGIRLKGAKTTTTLTGTFVA